MVASLRPVSVLLFVHALACPVAIFKAEPVRRVRRSGIVHPSAQGLVFCHTLMRMYLPMLANAHDINCAVQLLTALLVKLRICVFHQRLSLVLLDCVAPDGACRFCSHAV
jgi:hypothetical protein